MLTIDRLTVAYGRVLALHETSMVVRDGECVGLFGPNGAGKTTLARAVTGTLTPVAGSVLFRGQDITRLEAHRRVAEGIAHVPQGRRLFGRMTVRENLEIGAYTCAGRHRIHQRLDYVLSVFPMLRQHLARRAGELSGGQQQMIAIGRGLMAEPALLILDEPLMGLAPAIAHDVETALRRVLAARDLSVLLIEQRALEVVGLCQRGYVLSLGQIATDKAVEVLRSDHEADLYFSARATETEDAAERANGPFPGRRAETSDMPGNG